MNRYELTAFLAENNLHDVGVIPWSVHNPPTTMRGILKEVAAKHGIPPEYILSAWRFRTAAWPRQEFFYRACAETVQSLPAIGRFVGGRDHTTVIHGIREHARRQGLPLPRKMKPRAPRPNAMQLRLVA